MRTLFLALLIALAGLSHVPTATAQEADEIKRGSRLYLQCRACHTVEEGGAHKVGPNLWGIFGRKAGAAEGFANYSDVLKNSGIVWDKAKIDEWLAKPRDFLPGNRMAFAGVRKPEDRAALLAYLASVTGGDAAKE